MFPQILEPSAPRILWNASAQRFYNADTNRFVSNLEGIQTLRLGRPFGREGYIDMAGHAAPNPANLSYAGFNIDFANSSRRLSPVGFDPYEQAPTKTGYFVTLATYTDDNGLLKLTVVYNKVGQAINFDDEQRRIAASIAKQLNIPMGAEGTKVILQRATRLLHFVAR